MYAYMIVFFVNVILFVAKFEEAHDICAGRVYYLACYPGVSDDIGVSVYGHRQRILCTVGRLYGESGAVDGNCRRIPSAAGTDDFLLFSHRLQTSYQGEKRSRSLQ